MKRDIGSATAGMWSSRGSSRGTHEARRQSWTFSVITADPDDAAIRRLKLQLVAHGWHEGSVGVDLVLADGRGELDLAAVGRRRAYRALLVDHAAEASQALLQGAVDEVVVVGPTNELAVRLLVIARAIEARRRAVSKIAEVRRWSVTDALTGLGNRIALNLALPDLLGRAEAGVPAAVLIADIDHFKAVNDSLGHLIGDRLLGQVGVSIAGSLRDDRDQAFRYGGEEFVVLLSGASLEQGTEIAERLRENVSALSAGPSGKPVTISVGLVALEPGRQVRADSVLDAADRALYLAKREGRDRVRVGQLPNEEEQRARLAA